MAEDIGKILKAIQTNTETTAEAMAPVASMMSMMGGGMLSLGKTFMGFIKSSITLGSQMEDFGAKFSRSFTEFGDKANSMAEEFATAGIPASVYDAFSFQLQSNRLGLDRNTAGQKELFGATMATGESFGALQAGIFASVTGTKNQTKGMGTLTRHLDTTSRAFNMSREELVKAMSALSRDTLNLMGASNMQGTAMQETVTTLQGLIPDQRLFSQAVGNLSKQFTIGGLTESIITGFPTDQIMRGQTDSVGILEAMLDQGSQASRMMTGQGRDLIFQLDALKGSFGDLASKSAVRNQIIERAVALGVENAGQMTNKQLAKALDKKIKSDAANNKEWVQTLSMMKREIIQPLISRGAQFFRTFKKLIGGDLGGIMKKVASVLGELIFFLAEMMANALAALAEWFGKGKLALDITKGTNAMISMKKDMVKIASNTDPMSLTGDDVPGRDNQVVAALKRNNVFQIQQTRSIVKAFEKFTTVQKQGNKNVERLARQGGTTHDPFRFGRGEFPVPDTSVHLPIFSPTGGH